MEKTAKVTNITTSEKSDVNTPRFRYPVVDMSSSPQVDLMTRIRYWSDYLYRYYVVGRKKEGPYGSSANIAKTRKIEEKIISQCVSKGDAPTLAVPEITADDISPKDFHQTYLNPNTPVVFRGMAKEWESVKQWSPDFFGKNYANEVVTTRLRGNELNEEALQYLELPLSEVVENVKQGGTYYPGHTEDLFNRNPELREMLGLEQLGKYLSTRDERIMSTQLFLSAAGVRSGWHCTGGPNLFVQITGKKHWTFAAPQHSMFMHPMTRKDMFYAATLLDWTKSNDEIAADGYPLYRYIPKFEVMLEPGDVLFSPMWWWHCVITPEVSIGVATRSINGLTVGNKLFSFMWITSSQFRKSVLKCIKNGWGSDADTGAKLAFEFDQKEFLRRTSA